MKITNNNFSKLKFCANYYEKNNKRYSDVEIQNVRGIHFRPSAHIVKITKYIPDGYCKLIYKDAQGKENVIDATKIISIVLLHLKRGDKATVETTNNCPENIHKEIANRFEVKENIGVELNDED